MDQVIETNKKYLNIIKIVSLLIPIAVAFLLFFPEKLSLGDWVKILPHINAVINTLTSFLLLAALVQIKRKNVELHKKYMLAALVLGAMFLVSYVLYHSAASSTYFGDLNGDGVVDNEELNTVGFLRTIYVSVLLSHIGFSIIVVPFVLLAFYYSLTNQIIKHKKIVKFTFPIWLYVSVTGVIVYFLISPYYS